MPVANGRRWEGLLRNDARSRWSGERLGRLPSHLCHGHAGEGRAHGGCVGRNGLLGPDSSAFDRRRCSSYAFSSAAPLAVLSNTHHASLTLDA
jgi:hypothetical protein